MITINQYHRPVRGMTLMEALIALTVIAIGLMGVMSAMMSISTLVDSNHDQLVAINIARQKLAEIQNAPFNTLFSTYGPSATSTTTTNANGGTTTINSSGYSFTVSSLTNCTGKVIFPVNDSGKLSETVVDEQLGMPKDLNGNGNMTDTDVAGTYTVMPVRISVQWSSPSGTREMKLNTMLTKMK